MAMGLRWRAEAPPLATKSFPNSVTTVLVTAGSLVGIQRPGIYRVALIASGATTFQFQDTANGVLSAVYNLAAAGSQFIMSTTYNGDPLWQPAASGLGLQIVVGAATIVGDIWVAQGG